MPLLNKTLRGMTDHLEYENLNYYDYGSQAQKWIFYPYKCKAETRTSKNCTISSFIRSLPFMMEK